jgi:6-phosphofructokinase 1
MENNSKQEHPPTPAPQPQRRPAAQPRRIAVLTSGGDAPGMNAAIRSVSRIAGAAGIEVVGVQRAFEGLLYGKFVPLPSRAVANIIQRGGTILETSRSDQFRTP